LAIIAEKANPFFLRELYLDGCDKINDQALSYLIQPKSIPPELPDMNKFFSGHGAYIHNFAQIAVTQEEMMRTLLEIS
jgi:hypothetical protein